MPSECVTVVMLSIGFAVTDVAPSRLGVTTVTLPFFMGAAFRSAAVTGVTELVGTSVTLNVVVTITSGAFVTGSGAFVTTRGAPPLHAVHVPHFLLYVSRPHFGHFMLAPRYAADATAYLAHAAPYPACQALECSASAPSTECTCACSTDAAPVSRRTTSGLVCAAS